MKNYSRTRQNASESFNDNRRQFLKKSVIIGTLTGAAGINIINSCKEKDQEVTPSEDLMREHGALSRILLIYDTCKNLVISNAKFDFGVLKDSAQIVRDFVENYHEKLEEDFLFPRFEKAGQLTDLVKVLRMQHQAGRALTNELLKFETLPETDAEKQKFIKLIDEFNKMYLPHKAREDTVLFPAIKKVVTDKEYLSLGDQFEDKENEIFGQNGFETIVERITNLEKQLGIYDLAQFTPKS
jgi:hemerythrin-like domain-containing protein